MRENFDDYEFLILRWFDLRRDAMLENKFDSEVFVSLFKETFEVLKNYSVKPNIDRDIMDLVFEISGFVATRMIKIGYEHAAATEISEAMIHCCLYEEPHEEVITKGKWYIFSNISIDFTNPDEMLFDIATDIAKWDEIAVG